MHLWIQCILIREFWDQRSLDSFPRLFAAFHARHHLLMPRHPPCALSSLTTMIQNSPPPELTSKAEGLSLRSIGRLPCITVCYMQSHPVASNAALALDPLRNDSPLN